MCQAEALVAHLAGAQVNRLPNRLPSRQAMHRADLLATRRVMYLAKIQVIHQAEVQVSSQAMCQVALQVNLLLGVIFQAVLLVLLRLPA